MVLLIANGVSELHTPSIKHVWITIIFRKSLVSSFTITTGKITKYIVSSCAEKHYSVHINELLMHYNFQDKLDYERPFFFLLRN